jgi:hypothetical protein
MPVPPKNQKKSYITPVCQKIFTVRTDLTVSMVHNVDVTFSSKISKALPIFSYATVHQKQFLHYTCWPKLLL